MKVTETTFVKGFIKVAEDGSKKGWHERNGGNFSYRIKPEEVSLVLSELKPVHQFRPLGINLPNLANEYFLVTGSGKFMSNVSLCPEDNTAIIFIDQKGENYSIVWGLESGGTPTSELATHLLNHSIKKTTTNNKYRVIYHSHPVNTIALTFVLPLDDKIFTRTLWEMMTECPIIFPQGIGVVPWMVPGGNEIASATGELMKKHDVVIWAHHGIFCAGEDFNNTFSLMDTVEKSAEICVKVISMGGKKQTIPVQGFNKLAKEFKFDLAERFLLDY